MRFTYRKRFVIWSTVLLWLGLLAIVASLPSLSRSSVYVAPHGLQERGWYQSEDRLHFGILPWMAIVKESRRSGETRTRFDLRPLPILAYLALLAGSGFIVLKCAGMMHRQLAAPHECVHCGYDRRFDESDVCPECGGERRTGDPSVDRRTRRWGLVQLPITGLLGIMLLGIAAIQVVGGARLWQTGARMTPLQHNPVSTLGILLAANFLLSATLLTIICYRAWRLERAGTTGPLHP